MITMILTRKETGGEGTFGLLESEALEMHSGELPWHDNVRSFSCIPTGTYRAKAHISPRHGKCFWLPSVPGRTEILIHAANWMGDTTDGYNSDLEGCIAIGMKMVRDVGDNDQDMIQQSKMAMDKLIEYTEFKDFTLIIRNETETEMTNEMV